MHFCGHGLTFLRHVPTSELDIPTTSQCLNLISSIELLSARYLFFNFVYDSYTQLLIAIDAGEEQPNKLFGAGTEHL